MWKSSLLAVLLHGVPVEQIGVSKERLRNVSSMGRIAKQSDLTISSDATIVELRRKSI